MTENIREDAKNKALLSAHKKAFAELKHLGAAENAIIFTESKRTQDYLLEYLSQKLPAYASKNGEGIVMFNSTNGDKSAQKYIKTGLSNIKTAIKSPVLKLQIHVLH